MKAHVMVDLESLGVNSQAPICSIGLVLMNENLTRIVSTLELVVDVAKDVKAGAIIDVSTVLWWMQQSEEARKSTFNSATHSPLRAIADIEDWLRVNSVTEIVGLWGNGASADNVWLLNFYKRHGQEPFWKYKADRCFKTLRKTFEPVEVDQTGIAHNCLDDAIWQALYLIELVKRNNLCLY